MVEGRGDPSRRRRVAGVRTPAARRAPMSQITVIRQNAATKNRPDHFTPTAAPGRPPPPIRHGRSPSHGPARERPGRARRHGRASRRASGRGRAPGSANPASTQNARKMSSSAVRLCTMEAVQGEQQPGDAPEQRRPEQAPARRGRGSGPSACRPARPRTASRTASSRTATRRARSSTCRAAGGPHGRRPRADVGLAGLNLGVGRPWATCARTRSAAARRRPWRSTSRRTRSAAGGRGSRTAAPRRRRDEQRPQPPQQPVGRHAAQPVRRRRALAGAEPGRAGVGGLAVGACGAAHVGHRRRALTRTS